MKRRVAIGGAAILLPIILVLVLLAVLVRGTSLSLLTPAIERELSSLLQREVSLLEPPRLQIREYLAFELGALSIADTASNEPPLLQLQGASVRLLTRSILRGPLLIDSLGAHGLTLNIRIDEQGNSNLPELPDDSEAPETEGAAFVWDLKQAEIANVSIMRSDARDGTRAELRIDKLEQRGERARTMQVEAQGSLQDTPWSLQAAVQSTEPLTELRDIKGQLSGTLAELEIAGDMQLPAATALKDLQLSARIEGTLPPKVAALSPLLDPDTPLSLAIKAQDRDPGIDFSIGLDLPSLKITGAGSMDDPNAVDGVDLDFSISSRNTDPLLAAFGLPELDGLPLNATGALQRDGAEFVIENLDAELGPHRLQAVVTVPAFPDPEDTRADLNFSGPDASIYTRLAGVEMQTQTPYEGKVTVTQRDGPEIIDARVLVGSDEITLAGPVGKLPHLAGTELSWGLAGPSLESWVRLLDIELPPSEYSGEGSLSIDERGEISLDSLRLAAETLVLTASGSMDGLPELGAADLRVRVEAASLADSSRKFGIKALASVPATVDFRATGTLDDLSVNELVLQADGLQASTRSGGLNYTQGQLASDLILDVRYENLGALLGEYGGPKLLPGPASFSLAPRLSGEIFEVSLDDLQARGATGKADFAISQDFTLDANTLLNIDLRIDNPQEALSGLGELSFTESPLRLQADTSPMETGSRIVYAVSAGGGVELAGDLLLPAESNEARSISIKGTGIELHEVIQHPALPEFSLPFSIDAEIDFSKTHVAANVRQLSLAGTSLNGELRTSRDGTDIYARLMLPKGELQPWLTAGKVDDAAETVPQKESDRLIPDTRIPVDFLRDRKLDLSLETGPLGLDDPYKPGNSLLDRVDLKLRSDGELVELDVAEASGGRGSHSGSLTIDLKDETPRFATTMALRELPIALISSAPTLADAPIHEVDATFSARGHTVREAAASLDGTLLLTGGAGTLSKLSSSRLTGSFLTELFSALLPMLEKPQDVRVQCTVLTARAKSGVVELDPGFVMRSKRIDLSARGEIDLTKERLRVRFDNQARTGLGISAASLVNPYLQITGTFARPLLGVDVANSAIAGGAAVASGGLTVWAKPLIGRFLDKRNPCKTALKRWEKGD